jgi:hypothetical protein
VAYRGIDQLSLKPSAPQSLAVAALINISGQSACMVTVAVCRCYGSLVVRTRIKGGGGDREFDKVVVRAMQPPPERAG